VAESPLSLQNEIWRFFKRYKKSIYLNDERSHLLYISSFFKYFPNTTTRLLSSDGNKNIVNVLLPWGRYIETRWVSRECIMETLSVHTYYIHVLYRLGGFIFILTLENGNGRIFSVNFRVIDYMDIGYIRSVGTYSCNGTLFILRMVTVLVCNTYYFVRNKYLYNIIGIFIYIFNSRLNFK